MCYIQNDMTAKRNTRLDELLCLLDGKITAYRMKTNNDPSNKNKHIELIQIQLDIQELWLSMHGV